MRLFLLISFFAFGLFSFPAEGAPVRPFQKKVLSTRRKVCTVIKIQIPEEQYNPATMGGGGSFGEEFDLTWMSVGVAEEEDKGSSASLPITMRRAGRGRRRRG